MKKLLAFILALGLIPLFAQGLGDDDVREAVSEALVQAQSALKSAPFGSKTVAVLPFPGDTSGYLSGKLKNQLTSLGFTCIEGKEDPMWDEIVKEIAWDERKDDILDADTLVKFGRLKAAQILLYGKIARIERSTERIYVELELHATDLATKQHIWGGSFAARIYKGKDMQGIISLDNNLRMLLKKNFEAAKESLNSPEYAGKLNDVKTIAVLPLAGDIDEYLTGLAVEMLTATRHLPRRPQIPSLSQLRADVKSGSVVGDVVFYGAVRDLNRTKAETQAVDRKTMQEVSTVHADIQLFIEDLKTGNILWSKTITLAETVTEDRAMSEEERVQARREIREGFGDSVEDSLINHWKIILLAVVGLVALCFLGVLFKTYLANRVVR
jgi:PBP1b-binding outer membrane lipoprotein LpoB